MRASLQRIPTWTLTALYALALLGTRLLGVPPGDPAALAAALGVTGLFAVVVGVRGRDIREIVGVLVMVAAAVAFFRLPLAVKAAIMVTIPSILLYFVCEPDA